jgi:MFS superfamily sulfate permease-like transporter
MRWLPGLQTLRQYEIAWLRHDVMAGLVLTTVLVPVGIAYAVAAGLPGICGLYATIVPLLAYAVFGPSPSFSTRRCFSANRPVLRS